jgi:hypothetical protein
MRQERGKIKLPLVRRFDLIIQTSGAPPVYLFIDQEHETETMTIVCHGGNSPELIGADDADFVWAN